MYLEFKLLLFYYMCYHIDTQLLLSHKREKVEKGQTDRRSPIRTVIVSHMDVCKNKCTYHLSDKTHGDSDGDLFTVLFIIELR